MPAHEACPGCGGKLRALGEDVAEMLEYYLFAGSNAGGERAARIYSLLCSAKLNGLDPELYLHQVLNLIADHPINRIDELLSWNVSFTSIPS